MPALKYFAPRCRLGSGLVYTHQSRGFEGNPVRGTAIRSSGECSQRTHELPVPGVLRHGVFPRGHTGMGAYHAKFQEKGN